MNCESWSDEFRSAIGIASLVEHREQRLAEAELIESGLSEEAAIDFMLDEWRWSVRLWQSVAPPWLGSH